MLDTTMHGYANIIVTLHGPADNNRTGIIIYHHSIMQKSQP